MLDKNKEDIEWLEVKMNDAFISVIKERIEEEKRKREEKRKKRNEKIDKLLEE